jgi:hypothetical protein
MASSGKDDATIAPREKYRESCVQAAIAAGFYHGGVGVLGGALATLTLNAAWRPFRVLNASAKTAIVRNLIGGTALCPVSLGTVHFCKHLLVLLSTAKLHLQSLHCIQLFINLLLF